jgi:HTH-type transcriptional regulator / antitoxin HigA
MTRFSSSKYQILPIINEQTYLRYCEWVEELCDLEVSDNNEEEEKYAYIDMLTTLIEAYENKHFSFNKIELTIAEVIEQAMEQLNWNKKDLSKILGANRVSEIFSGKRQLSLAQIRILHKELKIPTDLLVGV